MFVSIEIWLAGRRHLDQALECSLLGGCDYYATERHWADQWEKIVKLLVGWVSFSCPSATAVASAVASNPIRKLAALLATLDKLARWIRPDARCSMVSHSLDQLAVQCLSTVSLHDDRCRLGSGADGRSQPRFPFEVMMTSADNATDLASAAVAWSSRRIISHQSRLFCLGPI